MAKSKKLRTLFPEVKKERPIKIGKWKFNPRKFNSIVGTGHAPSKRDNKDRANRNMDQLGFII